VRAVLLFIPPDDPPTLRKWMVILWRHCQRMRYMPEAVVHEWCDVIKMLESGMADKVIVARRDHADWLEVVSETPEPNGQSSPRTGRTSEGHRLQRGPASD